MIYVKSYHSDQRSGGATSKPADPPKPLPREVIKELKRTVGKDASGNAKHYPSVQKPEK